MDDHPSQILVVEDDPGAATLQQRRLERAGYKVTTVDSAEAAVRTIASSPQDLVVLDYRLAEGRTGLEVYDALRQIVHDLPAILVTGFGDAALVVEALRAGIRDFIPKSPDYLEYLPLAVSRILERSDVEKRLVESEAIKAAMFDAVLDALVTADAKGRIIEFNRAAEQIFGHSRDSVLGREFVEILIPERLREAHRRGWARYMTTGESTMLGHRVELSGLRADGTEFPVEAAINPIRIRDEVLFTAYLRDVSELKAADQKLRQTEEQLRQAQKMEAIGRLSGGIAHDINNLLTVIVGHADVVCDSLPAGDRRRHSLEEIVRATERGALITRQLLTFSRNQFLQPVELDLNYVLGEMESLLRRLIGEDIELVTRSALQPALVRTDIGQMHQVILNLAVNARDAMPEGGKLTLAIDSVDFDEPQHGEPTGIAPGTYIRLTVSDTGCGMDANTRARIFEPFFTTKPVGHGTGMGLATVYGIVKQNEGQLRVESAPGKGARFEILLPRQHSGATARAVVAQPQPLPRGDETVLLVEDEDAVRLLAVDILTSCGYQVLAASNGREALDLVAAHQGPLDLVVTDLVMPVLSGRMMCDVLLKTRPGLPLIFISGYTDDAMLRHRDQEYGATFIQKPFKRDLLAHRVREILDEARKRKQPGRH